MSSSNTNGVSVAYGYDDLGRLGTVRDNRLSGSNTTTYTYDAASNLATSTYPNGIEAEFTYDQLNRILDVSSPVSGYTYQLGPVGNRTAALEASGRSVTWNYDGIYRLTSETIASAPGNANGSVGYGLDPVGNRQSASSSLTGVNSGSWSFNTDDEMSVSVRSFHLAWIPVA